MKLSEIRAACEAATPGPWEKGMREGGGSVIVKTVQKPGFWAIGRDFHDDDARFVALARTALPALLEAVDGMRWTSVWSRLTQELRDAGIEVDE